MYCYFYPKLFIIHYVLTKTTLQIKKHPLKKFVQKSNDHRGIKIETLKTLDLNSNGSFVQEYIDKPFLVDGYKFDIGVYTAITSLDPLRVYTYDGDILFR